uniref:Prolyl 4-hydroxylase alpha subunit Fe(2+) 2OG dioxygenase domain-containing protein n=1 Tax=Haptolina ericina TaxID=156174 RepID=A0A7S3AV39_9EUKA
MLGWSTSGWNVTKVAHPHGFVLVIDGFLPPSLADTWHTVLSSTWYDSSACRHGTGPCDGPSCAWLYTTNDNGGNRKIRSVQRIAERRAAAESLRRKGRFCYSKWELTASHELYPSVGALMSMPVMRKQIAGLLGYDTKDTMGNIADYFVTAFDEGDFLSTHNDGSSGSAAWVLHLAKGWDKSRGGELRFDSSVNQPTDFAPAFNRMSLFLTRPGYVPHEVLPVRPAPPQRRLQMMPGVPTASQPRFGLTGWYMTPHDHFTRADIIQNELMKAVSNKAGRCY